jgi:hypothetical protein
MLPMQTESDSSPCRQRVRRHSSCLVIPFSYRLRMVAKLPSPSATPSIADPGASHNDTPTLISHLKVRMDVQVQTTSISQCLNAYIAGRWVPAWFTSPTALHAEPIFRQLKSELFTPTACARMHARASMVCKSARIVMRSRHERHTP